MTTTISDAGLQLASGNIVDLRTAIPATGTYTAGDVILESTTGAKISGWKRQTTGSNNVLGTDWLYFSVGAVLGTAVATTSGTAIDFTGIPSWVKRVTLVLNGVSTTGSSNVQAQLGSGSMQTTGYASSSANVSGTNSCAVGSSTTGMLLTAAAASAAREGTLIFTLVGSNTWVFSGSAGVGAGGVSCFGGGVVTLTGVLDRVRLTTVNGTDTFNAGSVNILYE